MEIKSLLELYESLSGWIQAFIASTMAAIAHYGKPTATVLAVVVLCFQALAAYWRWRKAKVEYDKECGK